MPDYVTVCGLDDLTIGAQQTFVVNQTPVAVFRLPDGIFALDDRCPHAGASLGRGYQEDGIIHCRIHHWGFRIRDGKNVDDSNTCHNAHKVDVRVVDSQVQIRLPEASDPNSLRT